MALFIKSADVGRQLYDGLASLVQNQQLHRFDLYPSIIHSDYFAVVRRSDDGKNLTAEVKFKDVVSVGMGVEHRGKGVQKIAIDTLGWKSGIETLRTAGYQEEEPERVYVLKEKGYRIELDADNRRVAFGRTLERKFDAGKVLSFAKNMQNVFDVLLKRSEEIEEYGFADESSS